MKRLHYKVSEELTEVSGILVNKVWRVLKIHGGYKIREELTRFKCFNFEWRGMSVTLRSDRDTGERTINFHDLIIPSEGNHTYNEDDFIILCHHLVMEVVLGKLKLGYDS